MTFSTLTPATSLSLSPPIPLRSTPPLPAMTVDLLDERIDGDGDGLIRPNPVTILLDEITDGKGAGFTSTPDEVCLDI